MTYPDDASGLTSVGFFTQEGKDADAQRQRLAAIAMQWFDKCQNQRTMQERQWYLNLAFYYGNQHVQFRSVTGGSFDLYVPKAPYYRVRIVVNHVRRIIRKEIARLTAQKPNAYVVPTSTEDADVFAAQAGEQIWDSLWRRLKFNKTLREAVFWQAVCGTGYIKSYWDPTKMDPDSDIEGDISIEHVSPLHIFIPDLMATDIEQQPYVIHAQMRSKQWIKTNLKVDSASSDKLDSVEEGLKNVMNITSAENKKDMAIVLEVWVKPGYLPELPKGGVFTVANGQVAQGFDEWPYTHGQYPFSKLDSIPTGKFYTASVIEDLIPLQKELNRSRGQLIESKNRMSKPQLTAQKGSVDPRKITTEPGQVIEYAVGFDPPTPLPLQGIPSYVTDEINRLYTDMQDLSGQHDVSNGSTPPGVTAATAISFLQEQDESLISTHFTSIEEAIEKIAGQTLNYVQMFWDEPHTVKVVGTEGSFDVQIFKGSDLKGNTDIRCESGSALPTSRAAKQAFIMDLMKMQFIPPDEGLEMMEIGGIDKIYERIQVDKRQAQRENLKMRSVTQEVIAQANQQWMMAQQQQMSSPQQPMGDPTATTDPNDPLAALMGGSSTNLNDPEMGQPDNSNPDPTIDPTSGLKLVPPLVVPVNTWDNHEVHIQVHNDYRKSQYYDSMDSTVRQLFEEHVKQHMEASANMMIHPLSGMDPNDPNAPDPSDEQNALNAMEEQAPPESGGSTGPVPSPANMGDNSTGSSDSGGG